VSNKYPCIYYDNGKCQKFSDDHYTSWCDFDQCEHITPSNADHIRSMTDEELAEFLARPFCTDNRELECHRFDTNCVACCLNWIKQPAEEDT
jgi:hypothetical protein